MLERFFACLIVGLLSNAASAATADVRVATTFALGGAGGWDYPSVDAATHRLYLSRGDRVDVVDTTIGSIVATIADTPGVHGIALAPALGRGYISCGKANAVAVFDLRKNAKLASVATGENPDAIIYEPVTQRVFAFNGRGHSVTVIDTHDNRVVTTIALDGKPEFARADGRGAVFVNIEDMAQLAAIDARAAALKTYYALPHCADPTGLAIDPVRRRGFSACSGSRTLAVLDLDSGKPIADAPIGEGSDGVEFDAATQTIFSANGAGNLSVIRAIDANHYRALPALVTQRGARTLTLDEGGGRMYLPTAQFAAKSPSDDPHARPPVVPESFVVLVVDIAAAAQGRR